MVEIKQELLTPRVPNFVIFADAKYSRSIGPSEKQKISIADLTDEQLCELAKEWKNALLVRAQEIRKNRRFESSTG